MAGVAGAAGMQHSNAGSQPMDGIYLLTTNFCWPQERPAVRTKAR